MIRFSLFVFLSYLSIIIVIIKQSSSILTDDQIKFNPGEQFSLPNKIFSIINKNKENVNQFRCPKKWSRLGGSCYSLSNVTSTPVESNHTCNLLQYNNSQLMYIRQPFELFYAAHILTMNNLSALLLEIDQDLYNNAKIVNILSSNDDIQWQELGEKFHQISNKYKKVKSQLSKHLSSKVKSGQENTNDNTINEQIEDYKMFENVDHIRYACHEIRWNVINNNSNILVLTVELDLNKSICSLSNMEPTIVYSHLCQYIIDYCFKNIICGKHGRCVNSQISFKCSCSFLYDGSFCEKFSNKDLQISIAIVVIFIGFLLTNTKTRKYFWSSITWFNNRFRRQQTIPLPSINNEDNVNISIPEQHTTSRYSINQTVPQTARIEFHLTRKEKRIRCLGVGILTGIFFLILFGIPAFYHVIISQIGNTDSSRIDAFIDHNIRTVGKHGGNTIFRLDNFIYLFISIILIIIYSLINKREIQDQIDDDDRSIIIEPIKLFRITDRYQTAIIIAIQTFDILEILEETLIDIDQSLQTGVFVGTFRRIFFIILIGFRYYPLLASLQFQNIIVRFLTFIYITGSMIHMIIHQILCIHWLPFSTKFLSLEQTYFYMDLNLWSIIYGFTKNAVYCLLIGYINAELYMRLFYDSIHITRKNKKPIWESMYRKIDKYTFPIDREKQSFLIESNTDLTSNENNNLNQNGYWFRIRKFFIDHFEKYSKKLYIWDENFRFTTIVICTYVVAFIVLLHLTSTMIFLYTTQKESYISYSKKLIELILDIEVEEWSFQNEVIISAIITMIIYGIQLLLSIKNYKKSMKKLYRDLLDNKNTVINFDKHEIIPQGMRYPGFILLYLLGGFIICFNLILYIITILNIIRTSTGSIKWEIKFIISILVVYYLQKIIFKLVNTLFTGYQPKHEYDFRLDRPYSFLIYLHLISSTFIGITPTFIRSAAGILANILFMPRIDYSFLVPPLRKLDTAYMSFWYFLRLEILYTYPILLGLSSSTQLPSNEDATARENVGIQQSNENERAQVEDIEETESNYSISTHHPRDDNTSSVDDEGITVALLFEDAV